MVHRVTTSGTSDNEWQRVVQGMTTSGPTSDNEWWVTTSDTTSDNKWQQITTSGTTNESQWEQVKESDFGFWMKQNMKCTTTIYSGM